MKQQVVNLSVISKLPSEFSDRLQSLREKLKEIEELDKVALLKNEEFFLFEKEVMKAAADARDRINSTQTFDAFISHKQTSANILANLLATKLESKYKMKVFLDIHALDNTHKLEEYIKHTTNFILIITEDLTESQWCRLEAENALKYNCNIITVVPESVKQFPDLKTAPEPFPKLLEINAIRFINCMDDECVERIVKRMWVMKQ